MNCNLVLKKLFLTFHIRVEKNRKLCITWQKKKKNCTERQIIIRVNTPFSIEHDLTAYEYIIKFIKPHYMIKSTKPCSSK